MNVIKHISNRLLLIMAVVGPGIITAFADNDAGGVATYTTSAATFGYLSLTTLIPITIVLIVTQEIGARIAIVTGKGLGDLIRERFGVRVAVLIFSILFLVNYGVILQNMSGLKSAIQLFGLPYTLFLPLLLFGLSIVIVKANYKKIQQFFFILIFFYAAYIISAYLAQPNWSLAITSIVIPRGEPSFSFLFTSIAVLGTTVTAWGQFFINSYVKDKKLTIHDLSYSVWEVRIGALLTNTFSFFMMVAVIATLFANQIIITDAADAAMAMRPLAGNLAGSLFGAGLLIAGLLGLAIVPLSTAYAFSEFFGYQGTLNDDFKQSKLFYIFYLIQIVLGFVVVMIPSFSLFKITLIADFCNGLMLPVLFYFLYRIANNEELLGNQTNSRFMNFLLIGSGLIITFGTITGLLGKIFGW